MLSTRNSTSTAKKTFIGTSLKEDEFVCNCSDLDEFIIFFEMAEHASRWRRKIVGKGEISISTALSAVDRTVYNVVYRDGKKGPYYIKRFNITSYGGIENTTTRQCRLQSRVLLRQS